MVKIWARSWWIRAHMLIPSSWQKSIPTLDRLICPMEGTTTASRPRLRHPCNTHLTKVLQTVSTPPAWQPMEEETPWATEATTSSAEWVLNNSTRLQPCRWPLPALLTSPARPWTTCPTPGRRPRPRSLKSRHPVWVPGCWGMTISRGLEEVVVKMTLWVVATILHSSNIYSKASKASKGTPVICCPQSLSWRLATMGFRQTVRTMRGLQEGLDLRQ